MLSFDDQASGSEGDLPAITGASLSTDVVASLWKFTRQPAGVISGLAIRTSPQIQAHDTRGATDLYFTHTATLALKTSDSIENNSGAASAGTATFGELIITGVGQGRRLSASGGSITSATSASFDVGQAQATIHFTSIPNVVFDGRPKTLVSTSEPAGLDITTTYDGSTQAPNGPGTYQVVATIDDAIYAGTATGKLLIEPPPAPIAGLQASPREGRTPLTVTFTNASQGFGYTFLEVFDRNNQTFDNPGTVQVTYDAPGIYETVLTILGQGGTDQTRVSIVVHGPPTFTREITSPGAVSASETLTIDLTGLDNEAGTWSVDLLGQGPIDRAEVGDGEISFIPADDSHGTQDVTITRTNSWGLSKSHQLTLVWTVAPEPTTVDDAAPDATPALPPATDTSSGLADLQNADTSEPTTELTTEPLLANSQPVGTLPITANQQDNTPPPTMPTLSDTETDGDPQSSTDDATHPQYDGDNALAPVLDSTKDQAPSTPQTRTYLDANGQPIYGLFDHDLQVGFDDYFLFAERYGSTSEQAGFDPRFDLDGNGIVNLADFFIFADYFGKEAVIGG